MSGVMYRGRGAFAMSGLKQRLSQIVGQVPWMINCLPWTTNSDFTDFTNTTDWGPNSLNISVTTGFSAPDGSFNGQKITPNTVNGQHKIELTQIPGIGFSFCTPIPFRLAAIVKASGYNRVVIDANIFSPPTPNISIGFNLATGAVGYDNNVQASQTLLQTVNIDLGDGWRLCYFDFHFNNNVIFGRNGVGGALGPLFNPRIFVDNGSGTGARSIVFPGDGTSGVQVWWFNLLPRDLWNCTNLSFRDDFEDLSTIDLGNTKAPGFNWYTSFLFPDTDYTPSFGWSTNPPSAPSIASDFSIVKPSVLQIWDTVLRNADPTAGYTTAIFTIGYIGNNDYIGRTWPFPMVFDALISYDGSGRRQLVTGPFSQGLAGVNAFWTASVEGMLGGDSLNPLNNYAFLEWDINEQGHFIWSTDVDGSQGGHLYRNPSAVINQALGGHLTMFREMRLGRFQRLTGIWLSATSTGTGWGIRMVFVDGEFARGAGTNEWAYNLGEVTVPLGQVEAHNFPIFFNSGSATKLNIQSTDTPNPPSLGLPYWCDWIQVFTPPTIPTVYTFFDPVDKGADIFVETQLIGAAGLRITKPAGAANWQSIRCSFGKKTGKWYWEIKINNDVFTNNGIIMGIMDQNANQLTNFPGGSANGAGLQYNTAMNTNVNGVTGAFAGTTTWVANDIIGFAYDADTGKVYIHKNGAYFNSGNPVAGTGAIWTGFQSLVNSRWFATVAVHDVGATIALTANFGLTAFAFAPPTGFIGWTNVA